MSSFIKQYNEYCYVATFSVFGNRQLWESAYRMSFFLVVQNGAVCVCVPDFVFFSYSLMLLFARQGILRLAFTTSSSLATMMVLR